MTACLHLRKPSASIKAMQRTDRFSESDFVPPRKGEIVRQASYKLPGALLDALAAVASEQRRPVVAVVRAALNRAITAHQNSVLYQEEESPMSSSTPNQLAAVERGLRDRLRDSGRVRVDLVDPAGGAAASLVPALALDRAFPVKVVLAEEGDPFTFYARGRLDGVRELGLQRMETGECSLQAAGMNQLPPVLASEDLARDPLAFAATPLLAELGDRVLCSALQRVLTTGRCRGDVSCRSCRPAEVLAHLQTQAVMLGPSCDSGRKPMILLSPQRYRRLAAPIPGRDDYSELNRLSTLPAFVRAFHGIPEDTSVVLGSELVVGLLPRLLVTRDGDGARLLLGVDAHLQTGSVVVADAEDSEAGS